MSKMRRYFAGHCTSKPAPGLACLVAAGECQYLLVIAPLKRRHCMASPHCGGIEVSLSLPRSFPDLVRCERLHTSLADKLMYLLLCLDRPRLLQDAG